MNPMISVIVPVYNVEPYLDKCIRSILAQTYTNLELILIDDGSQDNTGGICDHFERIDQRVKVIHKKNEGSAVARNYGLDVAKGEFIGFVDGDDFIDHDFYETLFNLICMYNTDIAMVSYRQFKRNCLVPSQNSLGIDVIERGTAIRELLLDEIVQNYVWNKLYRRKLFEGIRFPAGVIYDDINIMYDLIKKCNGIAYKDEAKYNYCLRETGIISTNSHKKREDAMRSIYKRYLCVESDFPSLKQYNAYSFTLWMIRLYVFTVIENDLDDDFLKIRRTLLQKIYDNNFTFIISKLKPKKRIVLLAMLWDWEKGKDIVKNLYE